MRYTSVPSTEEHGGDAARPPVGRVGPNAAIQLAVALGQIAGDACRDAVFSHAGLRQYLASPPAQMIPEAEAAALFRAVRDEVAPSTADAALHRAGRLTGAYVLENRIPPAARSLLSALPDSLAARLLLRAIQANAWTFAGTGVVSCSIGIDLSFRIARNPLATPGCPWHLGVLAVLLDGLAGDRTVLRHTHCCARGDDVCHTAIVLARRTTSRRARGALFGPL